MKTVSKSIEQLENDFWNDPIEFREGDKIEKLEEEFAYMKRVGDKLSVPPPPPPPPGLPVKH